MNIQIQGQSVCLLLVSILLLWTGVECLRFDLEPGHTKCIAEDIKSNSMTVGKYQIVNLNEGQPLPDSHKISVRVTSSYGNSYHHSDNVNEGHFAFHAVEAGDYMACFTAADHKPSTTITIDFDWKSGVAAKDWTNVAKKGSVELMELELKKMFDTVQSIHDEMFYLREREEEMQQLNTSTNSKMAWLSFLSLFVSLSVAGLQLWHLKSFFQKKKLI
ncbi:Transmembrane emp24 domain-containing protein p24delta9 [Sesamum angolense]|uniref:Transmembrane emp24 domain-containing protein p24delta9 n=1 Tax=Sesamum angolense TaxID=2727404 RepID=A0AAE1WUL1_9LAMI|nr:Transmembrane emp24 domain-containing protein p24delta9 [Sesamum angolense]